MANLDYIADSAPLPLSSLVLQIRSDLTDVAQLPTTANAEARATDTTCPIAQLFIG
ncbi:hypothetical protein [Bradyrhizobium sp. CCBAU 11361]|uniref:hypothetical protein n=1 Tax=Bradyrhizobium sp. CCBAU 11361 TaxID=1630812 RepID=UPI002303B7D6|nr:hypothetical protein [Bradyrhizobium sp. CCBAU 11361]